MPEELKGEYLDMYKGIQSEVINTTGHDKNLDWSTTYLGRVDITRVRSKWNKGFLYQNKDIQYKSYWMEHNVKFYWIQE